MMIVSQTRALFHFQIPNGPKCGVTTHVSKSWDDPSKGGSKGVDGLTTKGPHKPLCSDWRQGSPFLGSAMNL